MGVVCVIYVICALRTNLVLVGVLFPLPFAFCFLTAAFWYTAEGNLAKASTMQTAGGAFAFVTTVCGWYLFASLMFEAIDFPFKLPGKESRYLKDSQALTGRSVGDLSQKIKGGSEKSNAKKEDA